MNTLVTQSQLNTAVGSNRPVLNARGTVASDALGSRITLTQTPSEAPAKDIGQVTILGGAGKLYMGRVNGALVLVEIEEANPVATIIPGTTLLVTEM